MSPTMGCRFVAAAFVLAQLVSGDFVYDDKLGSGKSPVLPLGSPERMVRSIFEITRTTTGTLGAVGGQHSQLILDFGDQEPMLAVDLHTIRDPKRADSRLNLGAIFVLRIPYEDVKTSKKMNSAQTMTKEELKEAKAKSPSFAPKSIWRESHLSSEVSEQQVFSFLRAWHKLFAHRYGQLQFNCQVMIGVAWNYMTGESGEGIRCPNCHLFKLPSDKDQADLSMMVWDRQDALSRGTMEGSDGGPGEVVDTLDILNGTCGFRDRRLAPGISAFPSPRSLPFTKHQLGGTGTAVFRAYTLGLHHIGSIFDLSDHPLVFRGDLSYQKRAFTAAEHSLLYKDDSNTLEAAESTGIKVGPFTLALDLGGSLMRLLLNLPGHTTHTATVNTGVDLLKEIDLGRRAVMQADGQVKYRGRQRFTYAVTDTRLEIATGGMLDTLKIPLGLTGLLSKNMKFDLLSKHNMHAGSRKDLRYAGELVIVNKNPEHAHDVELWSEDDEYEMVFDNGSGSYKPYWPAPQLEELLHCNLPDIPGKFSIRVMRGSFGADQATLDAYCDVWHGVDDIPGTEECKKSLGFVAVQPEVHKCCGSPAKSDGFGTCVWKWPAAVESECSELPGHCCQESVVSQPGSCSAEATCQAQVMKDPGTTETEAGAGAWKCRSLGLADSATSSLIECCFSMVMHPDVLQAFLGKVNAGVKKWWNGRRDECWARQWRTRMFECLATHGVGKPSMRTETWLQGLLGYFASDSSNQDRWQAYLDNLQELGIKHLQLDHLQHGPTNLANDEVVVQCILPFLNNGFPYVPLSLKLWSFLKAGVYDPSEGKIFGANLHKLTSQYSQYIFDELDYKGENYKTGYDGEEGCPTAMTIPRAVDEWGNAIVPGHTQVQEEPESFELNLTAGQLAAVDLTDSLGTFEVQCGAVVAGAISPFASSLAGAMVTAVGGESTSQMSPTETKGLVERLVQNGGVQLRFRRGVDPSFCTGNICNDRTVIEGSDTWTRCGARMSSCGNYCCCLAGSEYTSSFLGYRCASCGA